MKDRVPPILRGSMGVELDFESAIGSRWIVVWENGHNAPIEVDAEGRWELFDFRYRLRAGPPLHFRWDEQGGYPGNEVVQTVRAYDPVNQVITWTTTHPAYKRIWWRR
eukprot:CAMPEP_0197441726 /NCGR_PEP_ID=MMETSP1175-20131217/7930_1 /TAXON_ID=1003142 /ORGANISM="Triceratium dubium, Strain CCMP147" /LENGTH=107 /DNA_ID=CAMNT_0042972055 /DNA_START=45 /DNA_END=364 /DNA_ORIENTATION=-